MGNNKNYIRRVTLRYSFFRRICDNDVTMKKRVGLCLCLAAPLLLTGCKLSDVLEPGNSNDYYKVNIYTDYIGFDADYAQKSLSAAKAKLAGYCYAQKNGAINLEGLMVAEGAPQYAKSTRSNETGHHWEFQQLVGFYDDGTAIDPLKITANCSLFAYFDSVINEYTVTFVNNYQTVWTDSIVYNTKIGETVHAFTRDSYDHDPEKRGRDFYYIDYRFGGYEITRYDDDGKVIGVPSTMADHDEINQLPITAETKIAVKYVEDLMKFRVKVSPVDEQGHPLSFDDGSEYDEVAVTYDQAVALDKSIAGKALDHYEGIYGEGAPAFLVGRPFDAEHVRYEAEVKAVYKDVKRTITVNFHEKAESKDVTFEEGDVLAIPTTGVSVGDGFTFAGFYTTAENQGSFVPYDITKIFQQQESHIDLYPAGIPTRICHSSGNKKFYYRFDRDIYGYVLENFYTTDPGLVSLAAADFWSDDPAAFSTTVAYSSSSFAGLLEHYRFLGISSLKSYKAAGATGSSYASVASFTLPDTVTTIYSEGLAFLSSLCISDDNGILDLSASKLTRIDQYAFKGDINIKHVILPSTIKTIGMMAFKDCEYLAKGQSWAADIKIPAGVDTSKFALKWNYWKDDIEGAITITNLA